MSKSAIILPLVIGFLSSDDFVETVSASVPFRAVKRGDYAKVHADLTGSFAASLTESGVEEEDATELATWLSIACLNPGAMVFQTGYLGDICSDTANAEYLAEAIDLILGDTEASEKASGTFGAVGTPAMPDANVPAVALAAFMLLTQPDGLEMVRHHPLFTLKKTRGAKGASDSRPSANRFFHETVMASLFATLSDGDYRIVKSAWSETLKAQSDGRLDPEALLPEDVLTLGESADFAQILSAIGRTVGSRIVTVTSPSTYPEYVALKNSGEAWRTDKDGNVRTGGFGLAFVYDGHRPDAKPRNKDKTDKADVKAKAPELVAVDTALPSA